MGAWSVITDTIEKDFLLINETLHYITSLEVKTDLHKSSVRNAINQTTKTKEEMERFFGRELNSEWKMIQMVYGDTQASGKKGFSVCSLCNEFVLVGEDSIIPKMTQLDKKMKLRQFSLTPMVYRTLVKYLLFCIHASPGPIVKSKEVQKVEELMHEAGRAENIALWSCWTLGQNSLMRRQGLKNVVMASSMATGKTECLVGKALELNRSGEMVLIIICNYVCDRKTLLHLSLQKKFENTKKCDHSVYQLLQR